MPHYIALANNRAVGVLDDSGHTKQYKLAHAAGNAHTADASVF